MTGAELGGGAEGLEGGTVGLQQHGFELRVVQGLGDALERLRLEALHVHLPEQRGGGAGEQLIDSGDGASTLASNVFSAAGREEPVTTRFMGPRSAVKRRLPGDVPPLGLVQEARRDHTRRFRPLRRIRRIRAAGRSGRRGVVGWRRWG